MVIVITGDVARILVNEDGGKAEKLENENVSDVIATLTAYENYQDDNSK